MRTIGTRINIFDNAQDQTVKTFNGLFTESQLTGYNDSDIVSICEITANATTRDLLINNIVKEHDFTRSLSSENDYIDIGDNNITDNDSDPTWLFYFV